MTSKSSFAYPAEYYYPEFTDNRPDEKPRSSRLSTSIDNGTVISTKFSDQLSTINPSKIVKTKQRSTDPNNPVTKVAFDIVTDQGLPDRDIAKSNRTDPTVNLVRDPAERNIPRLIVDDNIIQQSVRTPRIKTTYPTNDYFRQAINTNQNYNNKENITTTTTTSGSNYVNGDLTTNNKFRDITKKQVESEEPVNDYWKKEVHINDEGVVNIEPLNHDDEKFEGPFGLKRQGTLIFYLVVGILTLLAAVFLIMTGVFYGQSYPDSSGNSGKLAGIGICALTFYIGLQLILIALWHQKYRKELREKALRDAYKRLKPSARLKRSMEDDEMFAVPQQPTVNYTGYENYMTPPYVSNVNNQMYYQPQPIGTITENGYYESNPWATTIPIEEQTETQFLQPMEYTYGPQAAVPVGLTTVPYTAPSTANDSNNTNPRDKPEKRSHRHHHRRHHRKSIDTDSPKQKFDNIIPNSTVIEPPLPVLSKAPETNALLKSIAETEKVNQQNSTRGSNRIKPMDNSSELSSVNDHRHHRHRSRHRHHQRRRHHHSCSSCSSCSTCSNRSRGFSSDANYYNPRYRSQQQQSEPIEKILTARTPSPPKQNQKNHNETLNTTRSQKPYMKDSSVSADLEDVPNVRDNRLEQIPVVRRTVIVEPYPAKPTSEIIIKNQSNTNGQNHFDHNNNENNPNQTIIYASNVLTGKKSKKKTKITDNQSKNTYDLTLEDVNDDFNDNVDYTRSKKRNSVKTSSKTSVKNAFYA